ncbi:MAG: class I SAM-dependent methyltransferase [Candidatus Heimdallarchaeota archaeon]|nr:class I SAM-dependent methyltransferase [Candidatus Heimdallarchaeota archaeon]
MHRKDIVRQGYNKVAIDYLAIRNEDVEEMNFLPEFCSFIPLGGRVLDVGCGGGIPFTKYLSDNFKVIGIDISETQIKLAKKNVPKAQFYIQDMTQLAFPNDYFDGILAYYSIIHLPRDEQEDLFKNLFRMLKTNGIALFSLHSKDDPESIYDDFFGEEMFWSGFDAETNLNLLAKVGFKMIWSKIVKDNLSEDSSHLFVLLQKS